MTIDPDEFEQARHARDLHFGGRVLTGAPPALRRGNATAAEPQQSEQGISIRLGWRPPFDWQGMLAYLKMRAIPGVEHVTASMYSRTIAVKGEPGEISVQFSAGSDALLLTIHCAQTRALHQIAERVRLMFDLKAVSTDIEAWLSRDAHLHNIIAQNPGVRVPVAWDGFEVAVRAIVGQQVSVKAATTLVARLANACGEPCSARSNPHLQLVFPSPEAVAQCSLSGLGITGRRIDAIRELALAITAGELRFDGSMGTAAFVERITRIPGIGPWTAQYIALRALNDPDAFPHADLILLRAATAAGSTLTPKQLLAKAEHWRPWRAYAVMLLWRHYAARTGDMT